MAAPKKSAAIRLARSADVCRRTIDSPQLGLGERGQYRSRFARPTLPLRSLPDVAGDQRAVDSRAGQQTHQGHPERRSIEALGVVPDRRRIQVEAVEPLERRDQTSDALVVEQHACGAVYDRVDGATAIDRD